MIDFSTLHNFPHNIQVFINFYPLNFGCSNFCSIYLKNKPILKITRFACLSLALSVVGALRIHWTVF